jgi:anti-sigma B factor antagonist
MPDQAFTLEQVAVNGASVLRPRGPLTMANLFAFQNAVRELRGQSIVLDLAEVPYVDSAGLGALVNGHVSAQRNGGKFVLAGVVPRVSDLFKLTHVESLFACYANADEAIAALR